MSIDLTCTVAATPGEAWRYFASPGAFRRLSPPFMPLRPVREAASLRDGLAVLEPRTALPGPLGRRFGPRWHARHDPAGYVEGERFVDRCVSQPYAAATGWVHTHTVTAAPDGEALLGDRVEARVPGGALAPVFAYRYRQMAADLAAIDRHRGAPVTVAVTGASGLVGTALTALLGVAGHRVIRLVRGPVGENDGDNDDDNDDEGGVARDGRGGGSERSWDPEAPAPDLLDGVDVLVHLAGAPIAGRFTDRHVARVRDSRVGPTRRLAELVAARNGATAMVCASAIGYYGPDRGDEQLTEDSAPGTGPVADIVVDWERDCDPAREAGARVVSVRTGIALSGAGGMLPPLAALTRAGLGGRIGSGRQWMSWISLDDLTDIYLRAIVDPTVSGAVNGTAPEPVTNAEFTRVLGSVLRRPTLVPVPGWAPAVLLGERGADELALADQRILPRTLTDAGHHFRHRTLRAAFEHELGAEEVPAAL
ncbi:TIGR01777 family oxidoreductase [Dietzia cinnamea]|uniref:TIGR01777 family oxidoreductase n=1 Tax=Dietzia cinnamea TaxID=321318 RepID=UPI0021AF2C25|nr:TIGR01777 family oxidoreductase [Dietzia cinnamea]MCT1884075.1 TIGR01777 family oxidoreductase [Dietzia cinnamea]MCT2138581.1 TIGR01777 family oxidoreductase [Dietzia cinnamea]MCT2174310.1 TIGR01777 family oxidoreductase [Dietzia cinnamea]MCT2274099.1 TIGR01777 family oxidoreductase [Dietzia cinnamea]